MDYKDILTFIPIANQTSENYAKRIGVDIVYKGLMYIPPAGTKYNKTIDILKTASYVAPMFIATLQNKRLLGLAQTILYRTKIYIPPANIQNNVVLNPGKKSDYDSKQNVFIMRQENKLKNNDAIFYSNINNNYFNLANNKPYNAKSQPILVVYNNINNSYLQTKENIIHNVDPQFTSKYIYIKSLPTGSNKITLIQKSYISPSNRNNVPLGGDSVAQIKKKGIPISSFKDFSFPSLMAQLQSMVGSDIFNIGNPKSKNKYKPYIFSNPLFNVFDRSYIPWAYLPKDIDDFNNPLKTSGVYSINAPIMSPLLDPARNWIGDKLDELKSKKPIKDVLDAVDKAKAYVRKILCFGKDFNLANRPVEFTFMGKQGDENYKQQTNPVTLFENNPFTQKKQSLQIMDMVSYQAQSYMSHLYRKQQDGTYINDSVNDLPYQSGSLIKFWIEDINNGAIMSTPAFISGLNDQGLSGQWADVKYVGSMYPQFVYEGQEKRSISFKLSLGCFDIKYLYQYMQKLNFLRKVGTPKYKQVAIADGKSTIQYPKAPIYKMTLGDIIYQQYGYFEACQITWDDDNSVWNMDRYRALNNQKYLKILNDGQDFRSALISYYNQDYYKKINILNEQEKQLLKQVIDIQIPILTSFDITFVCIYGRGIDNNIDNWIYRKN